MSKLASSSLKKMAPKGRITTRKCGFVGMGVALCFCEDGL